MIRLLNYQVQIAIWNPAHTKTFLDKPLKIFGEVIIRQIINLTDKIIGFKIGDKTVNILLGRSW